MGDQAHTSHGVWEKFHVKRMAHGLKGERVWPGLGLSLAGAGFELHLPLMYLWLI